jgi:hypothetical protein
MRTELHFGAAAEQLHRLLSEAPDQMLILGISNLDHLRTQFAALFATPAPYSLMLVYRPAKDDDASARVEMIREAASERAAL